MKKLNLKYIRFLRIMMFILFAFIVLSACDGDSSNNEAVDPTPGGVTKFTGGTIDRLKALNADLKFDHLEISGRLDLDHYSNETITVNSLTVTTEGSIGYDYTACTYVDAPSIIIEASGDVLLEGDIRLSGRYGKRVLPSASCNSCYGMSGGNVTITAERISVKGEINTYGGYGGGIAYGDGCSGGASGDVLLTATDINLSPGKINSKRGVGDYGDGENAASGEVHLVAKNKFEMIGGSVISTGTLTFEAVQTEVCGPITYETLNEAIGGEQDITPPELSIQSPTEGSAIQRNAPVDVIVEVSDAGMGVREIQITGFGYDETHSAAEAQNGVLQISIPAASTPASIDVTAWDNAGHSTIESVSNLSLID